MSGVGIWVIVPQESRGEFGAAAGAEFWCKPGVVQVFVVCFGSVIFLLSDSNDSSSSNANN